MIIEIKVPQAGESVTEAMISEWFKNDGELVDKDEPILEFETDKSNLEMVAEEAGRLKIKVEAGQIVTVGDVIGSIDTDAEGAKQESEPAPEKTEAAPDQSPEDPPLSPAVRRIVREAELDPSTIEGSGKGGRILKEDALKAADEASSAKAPTLRPSPKAKQEPQAKPSVPAPAPAPTGERETRSVAMSMLRRRIASRLLEAQQNAAILTTFNEIDMSAVMALRKAHQDDFVKKYGIKLGFMSFFVKACVAGLREIPELNAQIVDQNIIYHDYQDIGVAVGTERGLVVPVIRNAEMLSFAQIEQAIMNYAQKAKEGRISLDDLAGGTFTVSNGGIYGSLLSTPILNPPQSGILGMHKIEKRAVVIDEQIEIRPMMYVALSYDHRIVDGKEAVTFLVKVKQALEDPSRMLLEL